MVTGAVTKSLFFFQVRRRTMAAMELIGVIGGMSWESTAEYLRLLNNGARARLGGLHSARLRVATVDFALIERMQADGDWSAAADALVREARSLQAAGAAFVLIATNTMHKVYDEVAEAVTIPVLHLGDVTAKAVTAAKLTRVGLLATKYTMEQSFYRDRLAMHGIQTLTPDDTDRQTVQRIIYDELCVGRVEPSSRDQLLAIARSLVAAWSRRHRPRVHGTRTQHQPGTPRRPRLPDYHAALPGRTRSSPRTRSNLRAPDGVNNVLTSSWSAAILARGEVPAALGRRGRSLTGCDPADRAGMRRPDHLRPCGASSGRCRGAHPQPARHLDAGRRGSCSRNRLSSVLATKPARPCEPGTGVHATPRGSQRWASPKRCCTPTTSREDWPWTGCRPRR